MHLLTYSQEIDFTIISGVSWYYNKNRIEVRVFVGVIFNLFGFTLLSVCGVHNIYIVEDNSPGDKDINIEKLNILSVMAVLCEKM